MRIENRCRRVYYFDDVEELLKKVDMNKLISEKFAEFPEDNFWSEPIEEDFQNIIKYFGFSEVETCWDVSYSQGSGASFEGVWCVDEMDYKALKTYAPQDSELLSIFGRLQDLVDITSKDCECFDNENDSCSDFVVDNYHTKQECMDDLRLDNASIVRCLHNRYCHENTMCCETYNANGDHLYEAMDEDFLDIAKSLAFWFYERLKAAYEYETSEENITAMIVDNEWEIEEEYIKDEYKGEENES